jgi:Tol biopolymer transport system component
MNSKYWTLFVGLLPASLLAQQLKPVVRPITGADTVFQNEGIVDAPNGRLLGMTTKLDDFVIFDRSTSKLTPTRLGDFSEASWSPKGDRIAFTRRSEDGKGYDVWTVQVSPTTGRPTGPARRVSMGAGRSRLPRFSPDGTQIAFYRVGDPERSVIVIPANGGRERVLYRGPNTPGTLDWSRDGKWIYFQSREQDPKSGQLGRHLMRVNTVGTPSVEMTEHPTPGAFLGFSDDGRFAAHAVPYNQPASIVIQTQSGKDVGAYDLPASTRIVQWSSSGLKLLAYRGTSPSAIFAINPATGVSRALTPWGSDEFGRYSPDGRRIAFLTTIDGRKRVVLADAQGRERRVLQSAEPISAVKWSPDGRYVAFLSMQLYPQFTQLTLLDVTTGQEKALGRMPPPANFAWRADSKAIVGTDLIPDSSLFVDIDLQGRSTPLLRVPGRPGLHRLLGSGPGARPGNARTVLLDAEWVVVYTADQIELRNLRDGFSRVVHRGFRGANLNFNHIRGISPDGKTVALYIHEEGPAGRKWITKLVPTRGGESRYVNTGMDEGDVGDVMWLADGRNLTVLGYVYPGATGPGPYQTQEEIPLLHIVPLNGEPWRDLFGGLKAKDWWDMSLASDGRSVLVTVARNFSGQVVEIDFTDALKNVKLP